MGEERTAHFISGGGTTAAAIFEACKRGGGLDGLVRPSLVIASRSDIRGPERLLATGVIQKKDIIVLRPRDFGSETLFGEALIQACEPRDITLFVQNGWAVKTPENFIQRFPRGTNQHPCLLSPGNPDFGGPKMLGRVCHLARLLFVRLTNRAFFTRAVAQRVHPQYDKGAILRQQDVEILPGDDVDTLAARLLPVEHQVQIEVLRDFALAQVVEIPAEEIVRPHEMLQWRLACEVAKLAYPKG